MAEDPRDRADRRAAFFALVSASLMIAQQVGSKATRDALFLTSFEVEDMPRVVIASAVASLIAVFAASRAYARFGPARVVPVSFAVSGALYVGEYFFAAAAPRPVAIVLYLHTALFGALVISGFWSVVNERFDPHSAKQMISRIGTGATFGGVAGGLLAERVGSLFDANTMLVVLAGLNLLAAAGVASIGSVPRPHAPQEPTGNGLAILRGAPYLRHLAALVLLTAVSAAFVDYAFKAEAARHFSRGSAELLSFFALFHVVAAVLSLVLQIGLAKQALERLGVAGSAATLPFVVLITATVATGLTKLATVVVARASELVVANSIFRSGYELLYTPVSPRQKRPTKALIDVAGNRIGDALGSVGVMGILAVVPHSLESSTVLAASAVTALASLWIARRLHRGYVAQLEQRLESDSPIGAAELQQATLQTLSTLGLDREALFEQIAAHESYGDRISAASFDGPDPPMSVPPKAIDGIDAPDDDPVHEAALRLRQGTAEEIRALLDEAPLDPRLVPHVIALLARRDVYHAAVKALRPYADEAVEHLVDALTDPDQPFAIRRRLPRVLQACETEAGARGLDRGLDDEYFEVRYRCGIALARIADRIPERRPSRERILERVAFELSKSRSIWDKRRLLDDDEDGTPLLEAKADRDRVHRSVEHVFTLLSLAYDPQPLRLALFALSGDDRQLRGTALEYLENVLPDGTRDALFPMLDARVEIRRKRSEKELVAELLRSVQAMDAEALREAIERERKAQSE
ncbi:MAG: hypothetical protein KC619_30770 [Myxococcales bacterium]|nr:hypothetical protein [Myxococcales bacterium]